MASQSPARPTRQDDRTASGNAGWPATLVRHIEHCVGKPCFKINDRGDNDRASPLHSIAANLMRIGYAAFAKELLKAVVMDPPSSIGREANLADDTEPVEQRPYMVRLWRNRRPLLVSTWLLRFRIALPSTAFTQRLSARAGATTASQGFGPTIIRTTMGHLSSIRTATTLRPFAAILRDRAVRNWVRP